MPRILVYLGLIFTTILFRWRIPWIDSLYLSDVISVVFLSYAIYIFPGRLVFLTCYLLFFGLTLFVTGTLNFGFVSEITMFSRIILFPLALSYVFTLRKKTWLVWLTTWAIINWAIFIIEIIPAGPLIIEQIFYDGGGSSFREGLFQGSNRTIGIYGSSTSNGGHLLLVGILAWLINNPDRNIRSYFYLVILCFPALGTLSRHIYLALVMFILMDLFFNVRKGINKLSVSLFILVGIFAVLSFQNPFTERLESKGSFTEDTNITARLEDGPMNFFKLVKRDPMRVISGYGFSGYHYQRDEPKRFGYSSNDIMLRLINHGILFTLAIYLLFLVIYVNVDRQFRPYMVLIILLGVSDNYVFQSSHFNLILFSLFFYNDISLYKLLFR